MEVVVDVFFWGGGVSLGTGWIVREGGWGCLCCDTGFIGVFFSFLYRLSALHTKAGWQAVQIKEGRDCPAGIDNRGMFSFIFNCGCRSQGILVLIVCCCRLPQVFLTSNPALPYFSPNNQDSWLLKVDNYLELLRFHDQSCPKSSGLFTSSLRGFRWGRRAGQGRNRRKGQQRGWSIRAKDKEEEKSDRNRSRASKQS